LLPEAFVYEAHFGLSRRPFSKTPDPAFLYAGALHGEALARLELAVDEREVCLFTGEIGAGKTTISRALIDRLSERHRVVLVVNPRLSASQLLELVAERLGVSPLPRGKVKLLDALTGRLFEIFQEGGQPLIIVDEAHLIPSKSVFEELRLLTNIQLDDVPLLSLILIGQPELRARLGRAGYASFAQRIGVAYHLGALDRDETERYITHRLHVAGRAAPLFSSNAVDAVYRASSGIPRRINTVCQSTLLAAYGDGRESIDADIVNDVVQDLLTHLGRAFAVESRIS
jgi:type II secretory pathway predicted ATPase ExeA